MSEPDWIRKGAYVLLKKYFEENGVIRADIDSFNNLIERELQQILEENKVIEPTIIPSNVDEFNITLDKIWVTKPEITEADGSTRPIYPVEARMRKLSYSAPIYLEVSAHINGVQRESLKTQIGSLPIMLHSKNCHLHGLSREELLKLGEDPDDTGGYFIINGTEKVIVDIEDLASNRFRPTRPARSSASGAATRSPTRSRSSRTASSTSPSRASSGSRSSPS